MKRILFISQILLFFLLSLSATAQRNRTDANIIGHVVDANGEHLPFATIVLDGTTIGTATDETGHFRLVNMPVGNYALTATAIGYKPVTQELELVENKTLELNITLEEDVLGLEEVVVTADRNEKNRREASVIVNTLTPRLFEVAQTATISDGLNFCPGLRMESNCQNCGFSQVRMNGMEGPYSQILINSRPIFSGLAGVYGLELIPSNMIERMEVIRGGGSALYGSNAIAGTINLILKDPVNNSYEVGTSMGYTGIGVDGSGNPAYDYNVNFNTSLVSPDSRTGMALYGYYRDHDYFDANDDGFSEITKLNNQTVGTRVFHRFTHRNKIAIDFFNIKEDRRGGNDFDLPNHQADIAEALNHNITTGAVSFDQFFRERDKLSLFISSQKVDRDSYYGAEQSLQDYGKSIGVTYSVGGQYTAYFNNSNLTGGIEYKGETLNDKKLGYPVNEIVDDEIVTTHTENTLVADQKAIIYGGFAQYEHKFNKLTVSAGLRYDHYEITDEVDDHDVSGDVLSPRVTLKYDILDMIQARASYSQGYRAPQIFDEDLHIETSGSRQVLHDNDPDLKQETSHSYMLSLDFNKKLGKVNTGFLIEGFYTELVDAFANEYGDPVDGVVTYTRVNAEGGATVSGVNLELNIIPEGDFAFSSGFTIQQSAYEEAQEFDEKDFFRTPNNYGYLTIDWDFYKDFCFLITGTYTGSMKVPYFGTTLADPDAGELRESDPFYDLGAKLSYTFKLNGAGMQMFVGMKNIFNSYQDDFDVTVNRDPGYLYGPSLPRTVYFGFKIGNLL